MKIIRLYTVTINYFFKRYGLTGYGVLLGLFVLIHGSLAVAYSSWPGKESACIGAAGLAMAYALTALVYWRQGWSGLMAFSMMSTGVTCMLQIFFPAFKGQLGILVFIVEVAVLCWAGIDSKRAH